MGIYDRDYERRDYEYQSPIGANVSGPRTLTTNLVIFIFIIYGIQLLTRGEFPAAGLFTETFALYGDLLRRPWTAFQLLTYGLLHDPFNIWHIVFNMFGLWMFGRAVEMRYGRREYLLFFCCAVVIAGLAWLVGEFLAAGGQLQPIRLIGASGGVAGVLLLFALNFPREMVYLFGVVPMRAWVFAILFVGLDLLNAIRDDQTNVAYTAHLGGAAFAAIYFRARLRLEQWLPTEGSWRRLRPRPKLRVHFPDQENDTDSQVDEILKKIQEHGQESLTRRERKILEQASREYQKRRRLP